MIDEVTSALAELLRVRGGDPDWVAISSLDAGTALTPHQIHLCLCGITEHPYLRNAPLTGPPGRLQRPPLGLRLTYVVTGPGFQPLELQARLGRVAQIFHSVPSLGPDDLGPGLASRLRRLTVRLLDLPLTDRTALWSAHGRPMQLALYYEADMALTHPPEQEDVEFLLKPRVTVLESVP
ncbi:Pvc16 family protein [Actinocorallia sp. B10E7]|uniref:Pvc16 family protein n=1 Tax=Actinocorallia sp. B10E7 TaxID=3153558 RepID=UPI00325EC661